MQVHLARDRPGLRRVQVLHRRDAVRARPGARVPVSQHESTCVVEMREDVWRRPASTGSPTGAQRPARRTEEHRDPERAVRRTCGGTHSPRQQLEVAQLPDGEGRALARTATSSCSATRRTPRTSRSAPARSWRWRTRSRWPRALQEHERRRRRRSRPTRRRASRWSRARSARRRPASSGSRTSGGTPAGRHAVRVQPAHAQPPHHLRQPAAARRGVRRRGRRLVRRQVHGSAAPTATARGRRCSCRSGCAG